MAHYRQGWRHRGNQANLHRPSNLHPAVEAEEDGRKDATDGGSRGRDERSARKWYCSLLPSETKQGRWWRTCPDPFDKVWEEEILPYSGAKPPAGSGRRQLSNGWRRNFPAGCSSQLRTLQRRLQDWRVLHGMDREVYFPQDHPPGREAQIGFTRGNSVAVTIVGQPYPHLLSRLILSHSGWRYAEVVAGETLRRGPPVGGIRQISAIRPAYRLV